MRAYGADREGDENNQSDHVRFSIESWWGWREDASKGKESPIYVSTVMGKREEQRKYATLSKGDRNGPKVLQDHAKWGKHATQVDQEG